jgi:hypothetical protein
MNRNFRPFYINSDAYEYRSYRRQYRRSSLHDSATLKHFLHVSYTERLDIQLPMQIATHPSASPFHLSFKTKHKLLRHNACVINHCCPFLFTAVRLLRHCIIATLIQVHYCFRKVRQMRRSLLSYFCAHTSKPANVPPYNTKGKGQEEQGSVWHRTATQFNRTSCVLLFKALIYSICSFYLVLPDLASVMTFGEEVQCTELGGVYNEQLPHVFKS